MKLSEAIREGAKMGPKIVGALFDNEGGHCALGGAYLVTVGHRMGNSSVSERMWPKLWRRLEAVYPCRIGGDHTHTFLPGESLGHAIISLNNNCDWSREAIAEWVETVEKKAEAEAAKVEVETVERVPEMATVEVT
jgi:hypothetical protein